MAGQSGMQSVPVGRIGAQQRAVQIGDQDLHAALLRRRGAAVCPGAPGSVTVLAECHVEMRPGRWAGAPREINTSGTLHEQVTG
jgi:hypothetical protein